MKMIYTVLVVEDLTARMESLLNRFRVGMNEWDRSKTFEIHGGRVVNYTIVCTEETHDDIVHYLYNF